MLVAIHPKLPMRDKEVTKNFYLNLGFKNFGGDYEDYLMMQKDAIEIHFFEFKEIIPAENDGQVYIRTINIETVYNDFIASGVKIHPNGSLALKPWKQMEFSILDPDCNLLTFGESQI
ncbi:VOC family protein [Flavobacterium sp. NST-5]|uniref:VOC family protein n=1 Tax=Flavobacterium ichthyis TaxID=2698827 RepID=A0ABW9Z7Y5_9FLAO|nr:VOC family protein [Flavobacterium ichthyis]NBL63949.1 VOC family protein [Flavobacterium ichthyis]